MENILAMVEAPKTSEIINCNQIDQDLFQELLAKSSVWDFSEITREEYMNKSNNEKKSLIIKFYNYMSKGKILLFVIVFVSASCWSFSFLLSGFCVLFNVWVSVQEHDSGCSCSCSFFMFSSIIRLSLVFSALSDRLCSVIDALRVVDSFLIRLLKVDYTNHLN